MKDVYIDLFKHKDKKIVKTKIEEVVAMVLENKNLNSFNLEYIKVQAIIARTKIAKFLKIYGGTGCSENEGADICDSGHCINIDYNNTKITENIKKAVEETNGQIIKVNGNLIDPRQSDTCGSSTENSENVISNKVGYLRRVLCDNCTDSPNYTSTKEMKLKDIEDKLDVSFEKTDIYTNNNIDNCIEDIEKDEVGRVISMKVAGKKFKGSSIMKRLGLASTKFSLAPESITFNVQGSGDGLGLCMHGAKNMAKNGRDCEEILNYYFTNINIEKIANTCINKPLKGRVIVIDPGHGGDTGGDNIGASGLRERDVVLIGSTLLKKELESSGAEVFITRELDEYITLRDRVDYSNKIRPDLLISMHMNAYSDPKVNGCEIYHCKQDVESEKIAKEIMKSVVGKVDILDRGVRISDFYVLRESQVVSIQIELDYITNSEVEAKFKDEKYIDRVVRAIKEGIINSFK